MENYQIDNLDRGILDALMANARTAYAEVAKQFSVSPGTIHVRVEKMKQAGIITVARIDVVAAPESPRQPRLDGSPTRKEVHDEYDRRDDEQDVDEVAADSTDDSEQPQNEDDHENCPKHDDFSFAECVRDSTRTRLFFPISIS
jgi:transposase-like protein